MTLLPRLRRTLALGILAMALPLSAMAEPLVAAAANVQSALQDIVAAYEAKTGASVRVSYGATGSLVRQIRQGAPFDLFLAADDLSIRKLEAEGLTQGAGRDYAIGRLALVAPKGGVFAPDADFAGLATALAAGKIARFAIASPEHAPYGQRAVEALRHAGLWAQVEPQLVLGENVAQAAQFVASGNADGGLIALSLALSPAVAARVDRAVVPADWHAPLVQSMALLPRAGDEARAFFDFLQGPEAQAIFAAQGYDLPLGG
jgi:molybdate transport system substrate-binding protein